MPEQHACDLQLELDAVATLREGIPICLEKADHGTREPLEKILVDEENGIDWIGSRLQIIKDIGVENRPAEQINAG